MKEWFIKSAEKLKLHKRAAIITLATLTALGAAGAVYAASSGAQQASVQENYKQSYVQKGDLTAGSTETGTVTLGEHSITSKAEGARVQSVDAAVGQSVKKGDVLYTLEKAGIEAGRESLQQALNKANAEYKQVSAAVAAQKAKAETQYTQNLSLEGSAPTDYKLSLDKLAGTVAAAKAESEAAAKKANEAPAILAAAEQAAAQAQAAYEQAKAELAASAGTPLEAEKKEAEQAAAKALSEAEKALVEAKSAADAAPAALVSAELALAQAYHNESIGTQDAKAKYDESMASFGSAKAVYEAAIAKIDSDAALAKGSVDTAKAALEKYNTEVGEGVITAECDGLVKALNYEVGHTVSQQVKAAVIAKTDVYYATVSVAQDDVSQLTVGMPVSATLDAFEGLSFDGEISSIEASPSRTGASTVSYNVTVSLNSAGSNLLDGMTGNFTFVTKQVKDVLYVSNKAVQQKNDKQKVKLMDENGKISEAEVETGFSDGYNVEIKSGLKEGDKVIIEMNMQEAGK